MGHIGDIITPVAFALSGDCFALSTEFSSINKYIGQSLVDSHYICVEEDLVCREFQENASILINGIEYRATIKLIIEKELNLEFIKLVGLLVSTAKELFEASGRRAFEMLLLNGEIKGVRFEAWWAWYEYKQGLETDLM